jgi:hypothetical protein
VPPAVIRKVQRPAEAAAAAAGWPQVEPFMDLGMCRLPLVVIILTAVVVSPALAGGKHPAHGTNVYASAPAAPTYDECFRLGWVRGVHVERGEWDDFYAQCAAGRVPFQSGMTVDSVGPERGHVSH